MCDFFHFPCCYQEIPICFCFFLYASLTNSLSCCTNQHVKSSYCKCFEKVEPANSKIHQISQWTVFHLSCEWGRRKRRKMKQKQQIWRRLLLCTLLANQVCASVCVCVFRAAGVGFSGGVFCLNFQGHSTHLWVRSRSWTSRKKKVRGEKKKGEER